MGYRSEVHLAVYTKTKQDFVTAFTRWRLAGGVDFTEWGEDIWSSVEIVDREYSSQSQNSAHVFGFLFIANDIKWYSSYPEVQEVEDTIRKLDEYGFVVEFLRVGEESEDIDEYCQASELFNDDYQRFFYPVTVVQLDVELIGLKNKIEGDKSWIANYVESTSTIGDRRSDTQPA